jgi:hypothetical protein
MLEKFRLCPEVPGVRGLSRDLYSVDGNWWPELIGIEITLQVLCFN